jgi:hypothetical protein
VASNANCGFIPAGDEILPRKLFIQKLVFARSSYRKMRPGPLWLVPLMFALSLGGCGRGNKSSAEKKPASKPSASAPPASSIDPATAAQISGRVLFQGVPPAKVPIHMDDEPVCMKEYKEPVYSEEVVVNDNKTLRNVFAYVKDGLGDRTFAAPAEPAVMDQRGCWFRPHVLGLMEGQKLAIRNSDPASHNVHPIPEQNREWNKSMIAGAPDLMEQFAHTEVMIPVRCNVHPWMRAYIGVLPHPFFAITDDKGAFTLKGLPPGEYTIEVWHERYGTEDQKIILGPKESKAVEFSFRG